jgi:hypothetical protein
MEESRTPDSEPTTAPAEDTPTAAATSGAPEPGAPEPGAPGPGSASSDEASGWRVEHERSDDAQPGSGREWLAQLQSMIEGVASQAAPVVREIGAKAAELAAVAGDKAGPIAHKAAEATEHAGVRIAERSREFAAELRRDLASSDGDAPAGDERAAEPSAEPPRETPVR